MSNLLEQVSQWIEGLITALGYPGVALVMFLENIFPPIPSELIMPFAGFQVGQDPARFSFVGMWIAGVIGSVAGALVLYYLGMWAGDAVVRRFVRRYGKWFTVSEADYDRALRFFGKYGSAVVFFGRLIPIIRSIISIPAGANRMPLPQFLLYTTIGSAIWSGALCFAGLQLGENWTEVQNFMDQYQDVVIVVGGLIIVLLVIWFVYSRIQRRRNPTTTDTTAA